MSHLTPSIPKAMINIFEKAKITYEFLDEDGSLCCGRPLMQSGLVDAATQLQNKMTELIMSKKSMVLVTSCPICYKTFKDDYKLKKHVLHHSELIKLLIDENRINLKKENIQFSYHDPCELGRGCGEYENSREVLKSLGHLQKIEQEKEKALCCGGSLSNLKVPYEKRELMAADAVKFLDEKNPDVIVTACPLCKKTMEKHANGKMKDLAEVVSEALNNSPEYAKEKEQLVPNSF